MTHKSDYLLRKERMELTLTRAKDNFLSALTLEGKSSETVMDLDVVGNSGKPTGPLCGQLRYESGGNRRRVRVSFSMIFRCLSDR